MSRHISCQVNEERLISVARGGSLAARHSPEPSAIEAGGAWGRRSRDCAKRCRGLAGREQFQSSFPDRLSLHGGHADLSCHRAANQFCPLVRLAYHVHWHRHTFPLFLAATTNDFPPAPLDQSLLPAIG